MSRVTARRRMRRITPSGEIIRPDTLAVEEPLEIRVRGESLTVTMRTPGHDIDLVHGFLFAESLIAAATDIRTARYCAGTDDEGRNSYNVLDIDPAGSITLPNRPFLTTGACGLCGRTALDEIRQRTRYPLPAPEPLVEAAMLAGLPEALRKRQSVFDATGGLHAAGLFTLAGEAVVVREDIGRHNAVDKVIGWALRENRIPATDLVLVVSGRASFELAQKAVLAGIPILAAVSAPSSLAVDLAAESGLTLAGFVRGDTMNIYTCPERINVPADLG